MLDGWDRGRNVLRTFKNAGLICGHPASESKCRSGPDLLAPSVPKARQAGSSWQRCSRLSGKTSRTAATEAECTVTNGQDRRAHATALQIAQQLRPGFSRLPIAITDGDQFFVSIGAHADQHQARQAILLEADVEVHVVGPQ